MKTKINKTRLIFHDPKSYYKAINENTKEIICNNRHNYGYVCWGDLMDYLGLSLRYSIKMTIDIYKTSLENGPLHSILHGCLLSKKSLDDFLKEISETYIPFKEYSISENNNKYVLEVAFKENTKKEILWMLSLIRHLYEFPFNAFLSEALALRGLEEFKNEHITNLLQLVAITSHASTYTSYGGFSANTKFFYYFSQSLGGIKKKLVTVESILEKLKNNKGVTSCYHDRAKSNNRRFIYFPKQRIIDDEEIVISSYAYWFDYMDKKFEDFKVKAYLNNYKILKGE